MTYLNLKKKLFDKVLFSITSQSFVFSGEAENTNFIVFGLTILWTLRVINYSNCLFQYQCIVSDGTILLLLLFFFLDELVIISNS
jgi:hypothetical protein